MIKVDNLTVKYGNKIVLEGLNLEIKSSSIHGLVGLNGAGKTTLLNTIYGIKKMVKGKITYLGDKIKRDKIAYLETINYFYPRITGKEYLTFFKTQNPAFNIEEWNKLFELPLNNLIDSYSSGMKKKLAFIGIMCLNRPVVILDEPFNGVDLETVQKIKSILLHLTNQNKIILVTSHILESLINICDAISYLNNKNIQFTKSKTGFSQIEKEIFALHQDKIDNQVKYLLGTTNN